MESLKAAVLTAASSFRSYLWGSSTQRIGSQPSVHEQLDSIVANLSQHGANSPLIPEQVTIEDLLSQFLSSSSRPSSDQVSRILPTIIDHIELSQN